MNETRRLITKALPSGWILRKNFDVQDGSQYGNKWTIVNEYGRIVIVGKTLERILEQLEGVNDAIYFEELEEYELEEPDYLKGATDND